MPAFERTHLLRDDLNWLPRWLKAVRWTVAGGFWTAALGAAVGLAAAVPDQAFFLTTYGGAALVAGGLYTGDKVARSVLRKRLARLAHGDVDIKRLKNQPDGELVHVK